MTAFEEEFAAASGARFAVGVGTGTDALALTLRALGIGAGDEVITAPLSAAFSALAIVMAGATPVFADIDPARLTLDPAADRGRDHAADAGDHAGASLRSARGHRRRSTPSHGATRSPSSKTRARRTSPPPAGGPVGTFGIAGAFSFYPTKNLGALGDGGAVVTNDAAIAEKLKRLRNGGQTAQYRHDEFGVNSRLDEMQAAILRARLAWLPEWTTRRRELAARYRHGLAGAPVEVPPECDPGHVYHLFPVLSAGRDLLQAHLAARGIGTLVHYPVPIPRQRAFAHLPSQPLPVGERIAKSVLSLPLHALMSDADVDIVAAAVHDWRPRLISRGRMLAMMPPRPRGGVRWIPARRPRVPVPDRRSGPARGARRRRARVLARGPEPRLVARAGDGAGGRRTVFAAPSADRERRCVRDHARRRAAPAGLRRHGGAGHVDGAPAAGDPRDRRLALSAAV